MDSIWNPRVLTELRESLAATRHRFREEDSLGGAYRGDEPRPESSYLVMVRVNWRTEERRS
jgi:hypothetical protein